MKILTIKVEEPQKVSRNLLKVLKKVYKGEDIPVENVLTFTSVGRMFKTLTPARWEIIEALQHKEFKSIRELAKHLKRDYSNVWKDIQILHDLGIVEMKKTDKGWKVSIPYQKIVVEFPKTAKV